MLALGYLSLCLRGSVPDSVSILAVNGVFPLGMVLHLSRDATFLGTNSYVAAMVRFFLGALSRLRLSFTTATIHKVGVPSSFRQHFPPPILQWLS